MDSVFNILNRLKVLNFVTIQERARPLRPPLKSVIAFNWAGAFSIQKNLVDATGLVGLDASQICDILHPECWIK